jgi:hypothetical protein
MSKSKTIAKRRREALLTDSDPWNFYERLNFIPPERKDKVWAAQSMAFVKGHSAPFQDPNEAATIRKKMSGEIDIDYHKKRIDPDKGEAEFFSADWKACPIDNHLDEIIETTVKQIPLNLGVKAVDEYSISNKQKNNRKIIGRAQMQNLINGFNEQLGLPLLKKTDDPFKYIEQVQAQLAGAQQAQQPGTPRRNLEQPLPGGSKNQLPTDVLETLISQIGDNNELLGIYNQFLHKEGVEIACELGINYYLNVKNKFVFNHASNILRDIKAFGKCCGRLFTSKTTGTPVFRYYRPEDIYISAYSKRDLSDHMHWYVEEEVTFSDFMRMFGADLDEDQLRNIFELNRRWNGINTTYDNCGVMTRMNAKIRIGYMEWESQDMEVYADYEAFGNKAFKRMPSDFVPGYRKDKQGNFVKDDKIQKSERVERHYNVWYKCYYIPDYQSSSTIASLDFEKQSEYIFDFGKLQDQERYGDDEQFARSSLVGCYSDRMTWYEIKDRFMKEINHLWLLFQNDLSNVMPAGLNWAYDLIVQMTSTVDDANKNNKDAVAEWAAKVKQTGSAITRLMKDAAGNPMGNVPPFQKIDSGGFLEGAMAKLEAMMVLYTLMIKSLGQNEISEGGAPKPRTNMGSIEAAMGTSGKAAFYVEELYTDVINALGNKMLKYFKDIVEEGDTDRMKEFEDIVGQSHAMALKEIKGIPMRNLGLHVENVMTKDQKDMVMQLAQSMSSAGTLDIDTALFLTTVDNLKQAYAILCFKKDLMDKKLAEQAAQQQEYAMQLESARLQTEVAKIKAAGEMKIQLEKVVGDLKATLEKEIVNMKGHWTLAGKEQIKQNRIEENITQSQIDKQNAVEEQEKAA